MKELSIFIDESGDFGEYAVHSPFYIIAMVFHDQSEDIQPAISKLNQELSYLNLDNLCIHTGPIIRKEGIYEEMEIDERRRIFNKMVAFIRQINIRYKCFYIEKKHISDVVEATGNLSKQISRFVKDNYEQAAFEADPVISAGGNHAEWYSHSQRDGNAAGRTAVASAVQHSA